MILVRLRVESANLPLPKGIVECGVYLVWGDVETGRSRPVDGEVCAYAICLLVRSDISDLRQLAKLRDQPSSPLIQLQGVRIFERVLVFGPTHSVIDCQVLYRLQVRLNPLHVV